MQTILGANGAIGIELAQHLKNYTQEIKLVSRNPRKVNEQDILFAADLTARKNVLSAVEGSEVVYVTIGFKYSAKVWRQLWLPFMENVIEACRKHKSKLVFFDNIYAIGGDNVKHITESSPTSPTSKKGEIRAEVDELIMKNVEGGFLDAIIARAPDFFGGVSRENSILINLVYDRMIKGKRAQWLCDADKIHSFGYVPELAKGTAMLGNAETAYNQIWNLPVDNEKLTGKQWVELFAKEMNTNSGCSVLPNWLLKSLGILNGVMAEIVEMNYQYDRDYFFDSSKFNRFFDYTPVSNGDAVREAIDRLGK